MFTAQLPVAHFTPNDSDKSIPSTHLFSASRARLGIGRETIYFQTLGVRDAGCHRSGCTYGMAIGKGFIPSRPSSHAPLHRFLLRGDCAVTDRETGDRRGRKNRRTVTQETPVTEQKQGSQFLVQKRYGTPWTKTPPGVVGATLKLRRDHDSVSDGLSLYRSCGIAALGGGRDGGSGGVAHTVQPGLGNVEAAML